MRWSKKNKGLIKQVIDRYYWMLGKKSRKKRFFGDYKDCPFCPIYFPNQNNDQCYCNCIHNPLGKSCPNSLINENLNTYNNSMIPNCVVNAHYIGLKCSKYWIIFKTESNIKKRLQFWKDALALTKEEFVRRYKKC